MKSQIAIEGIHCYAHHGCLEEEGIIGGKYMVDVYIDTDLGRAAESDALKDTVDYETVCEKVREEMAVRSKLIEHVCARILASLERTIQVPARIAVRVTKFNPPVQGQVEKTSIFLSNDQISGH